MHSEFYMDKVQELEPIGRAANRINNSNINNNTINNRSKTIGPTTNGPEDLERRCQQCQRYTATFMCGDCKNQWYCSKECQVSSQQERINLN